MKALALEKEQRFESSHAFGDALTGYLYSSTPRFSALSLSHFVQELFREDLSARRAARSRSPPPSARSWSSGATHRLRPRRRSR